MGGCFSKKKYRQSKDVNGYRSDRAGTDYQQSYQSNNQKQPVQYTPQQQPPQERPYQPHPQPQPQPQPRPPSTIPVKLAEPQGPRPVQRLEPNAILEKPFEDIKAHYTLGGVLGKGQFGVTYLCTEKATGQTYACKSILKRKLVSKNDKEDMKREIHIMQHLSGQPNIVEFKGAYEDRQSVHIVMEVCAGGELFDRIVSRGHYSERDAANLIRQIVNVVHICHFMGVMHRDLKPENFLLTSKSEKAMLKATDFGLSVFIEKGEYLFVTFCVWFIELLVLYLSKLKCLI